MTSQPPAAPRAADIEDTAREWFVRSRGRHFGVEEEIALRAWLDASALHAQAFAGWQDDWRALDSLPAARLAAIWRQIAIEKDREAQHAKRPAPITLARRALAATMLLVGAGAAGYMAWNHQRGQALHVQQFATERGQQLEATLPDSSRVRLDTASGIEVRLFRERRELRLLHGQVLIDVAGDPARPFEVLAGPLRVTVVGTRFSVRYTDAGDPQSLRVAVESGRVRVGSSAGTTSILELRAGQQVSSDPDGRLTPVGTVPAAGIAPWRDHLICVEDATLDHLLAEFARYGTTRLAVNDPAVAKLRLTGSFDARRPDEFARLLPQVLPVRLQARGSLTLITAAR